MELYSFVRLESLLFTIDANFMTLRASFQNTCSVATATGTGGFVGKAGVWVEVGAIYSNGELTLISGIESHKESSCGSLVLTLDGSLTFGKTVPI